MSISKHFELPFLVEKGLVEARASTGTVLTLPLAMQVAIGTEYVQYFHTNFDEAAKATLRSPEDLMHVLESVGPILSFTPTQHYHLMIKTLDTYNKLMHSECYELCPEAWTGKGNVTFDASRTKDNAVQQRFFKECFRQLSLLFQVRSDYQVAESQHIVLCSILMNNLSSFMVKHENLLDMDTWHLILRVLFGSLHYIQSHPNAPIAIRTTLSSLAFEALIRSKTKDLKHWKLCGSLAVLNFSSACQWAVAVSSFARFAASGPLSGRFPQSTITLRWQGIIDGVRKESVFHYKRAFEVEDITFMWKQLLALYDLAHIADISAYEAVMLGLRDSAIMLSKASSFENSQQSNDSFNYSAPQTPAPSVSLSLCPSTNALVYFGGMRLLQGAVRHESFGDGAGSLGNQSLDGTSVLATSYLNGRLRAVEGACAVFLRRETENSNHCTPEFRNAFFSTLAQLCHDENSTIRGTALHQALGIYTLDLELPTHLVDSLTRAACGFLEVGLEGNNKSTLDDDDDEEILPIEDPELISHGGEAKEDLGEDGQLPRKDGVATVTAAQQFRRAAISHVGALLALAHKNRKQLVPPLLVAVLNALENHTTDATLVQKGLSIVTLNLNFLADATNHATSAEDIHKENDVAQELRSLAMALLKAPLGLHSVPVLVASLNALVSTPITEDTPARKIETLVQSLCGFLVHLRKSEQQVETGQADLPGGPQTLVKLAHLTVHRIASFLHKNPFILQGAKKELDQPPTGTESPEEALKRKQRARSVSMVAQKKDLNSVLEVFAKTMDEMFKPLTVPGTALVREAALSLYHVLHLSHFYPLVEHGWCSSSILTEGSWLSQCPKQLKLFAVNGDHLLTVITLRDGKLITIQRDQFGTRCWKWEREKLKAPEQRSVPSPTADRMHLLPVENNLLTPDGLSKSQADERTNMLKSQWNQDPAIVDVMKQGDKLYQSSSIYKQTSNFVEADLVNPFDDVDEAHAAMRHWMVGLGLAATTRLREIPFDRTIVSELKFLDTLKELQEYHVDILYLTNNSDGADGSQQSEGFKQFLLALGWRQSMSGAGVASDTPQRFVNSNVVSHVEFVVKTRTPQTHVGMENEEEEAVKKSNNNNSNSATTSGSGMDNLQVRLIWDETSLKVEADSTGSAQNELFAQVSPQWRRSSQSRYLDIIITPLPHVGLFSIRVARPSIFRNSCQYGLGIDDPVRWGAPLLHGSLVPSSQLGRLVADAVRDACHYRLVESMKYRPTCTTRRQAIHALITRSLGLDIAGPLQDPVFTQSIVGLFSNGCSSQIPASFVNNSSSTIGSGKTAAARNASLAPSSGMGQQEHSATEVA